MVNAAAITALRVTADVLVPGCAEFLDVLINAAQALCKEVQRASHTRNQELCDLLAGLLLRIDAEKHEGRSPSADWSLQFKSLFDCIYAHVIACADKSTLEVVWSWKKEKAQVAVFSEAIDDLVAALGFHHP